MDQRSGFAEDDTKQGHAAGLGGATSTGLDPKIAAVLSYALSAVVSFLGGLIFFLIEKENKFIRFHALQSVFFNVAMIVASIAIAIVTGILAFIPIIGWLIGILLWAIFAIGGLVYWIILIIKSSQGEYYRVPVISDWAEKMM